MFPLISSSLFSTDITHDSSIDIDITPDDKNNLPHQFLDVVQQLNQTYLHWKHLQATKQATHATFFLYTKDGIQQAIDKAAASGNPIDQQVQLILETNLALATVNSLLLAGENYLKTKQLQDCKDSIDTALSTLYEFVKTREKLSQSQDIAVESIRHDILNDSESTQYATYGIQKVSDLHCDARTDQPNLYVVRQQLTSLQKTFTLICPEDIGQGASAGRRLDSLISNIFIELVKPDAKITTNRAGDGFSGDMDIGPAGLFSPNGVYYLRQVDSDEDPSATNAKLIEVKTGEELDTIAYQGRFSAMSFSNDGRYLATVLDTSFKIIDISTGDAFSPVQLQSLVKTTCFSPDGTHIAAVSIDQNVKIVEVATGKTVRTLTQNQPEMAKSICFSPRGTYMAVPNDKTIKILAVATGHEVTAFPHTSSADVLCFSPDEGYIATTTGSNTQITKVSTGEKITSISHQGQLRAISSSPVGTYLAISLWDNTVRLIKVVTETGGRNTYTIQHNDDVNAVAFSTNGSYLATASSDQTVKLIKVATGRRVTTIDHETHATALSFAANHSYLATASLDGTVKLLELPKLIEDVSEEDGSSAAPQVEEASIVHINQAEAFFKTWRLEQANASSFYEFMLSKAEQGGLCARYNVPILDTNLLLEALFFLIASAEKNYQTICPYLDGLDSGELYLPALHALRDNVSAALSSLYEFIHGRMGLDQDSYAQAIDRFQRDIEVDVYTSQLVLTTYEKTLAVLRYDGIKQSSEFRTVQGMLNEIFSILDSLLPDEVRRRRDPGKSLVNRISTAEAMQVIDTFGLQEDELITLLTKLKHSGVMNSAIALAAISKVTSKTVIDLCRGLPTEAINKQVALLAIEKRRKTHYIGTLMPWVNIAQRDTLLRKLETAPRKTWWRR